MRPRDSLEQHRQEPVHQRGHLLPTPSRFATPLIARRPATGFRQVVLRRFRAAAHLAFGADPVRLSLAGRWYAFGRRRPFLFDIIHDFRSRVDRVSTREPAGGSLRLSSLRLPPEWYPPSFRPSSARGSWCWRRA